MYIKIDTRFETPGDLALLADMLGALAKVGQASQAEDEKCHAQFRSSLEGTETTEEITYHGAPVVLRKMPPFVPLGVPTADYVSTRTPEQGIGSEMITAASVSFPNDVELGKGNEGMSHPTPFIVPTPLPPGATPPVVELDSTGVPWDGRIHSVGRSKVANGTWRLRRGVDDMAVKAVESQQQFAASVPPVPAAAVMSFGTLMQRITALTVSGEMTPGEVAKTLRDAGLPAIPALASRPDLIGGAAHALGFAT